MPDLVISVTAPKLTPMYAPVTSTGSIGLPVVYGGFIRIPPGCAGLVGVRLSSRGRGIYPLNFGFATGDDERLSFETYFRLDGWPYLVTLEIYNLDDTNDHAIQALVTCGAER